jgi:hypothetical protein
MKKLPVIALAMFFALGSTLALAQGAGGGAGSGAGKTGAGKTDAGKTRVRHAQVRLAQVVGPVAVIPPWISKMQVERRRRECPSIEPDSRRAAGARTRTWD